MAAVLPRFRYHPDPLATGSVGASDEACAACGDVRGYVYAGPVYAPDGLSQQLCPWCVADGSAARRFEASFTDMGDAVADEVPQAVGDEIEHRTPGFSAWQQDHWMYHCADGCEFVGPVGAEEWPALPTAALDAILAGAQELGRPDEKPADFLGSLDRDEGPTAYLFRCRHCGGYQSFSDSP